MTFTLKNITGAILYPIFYFLSIIWFLSHRLRIKVGRNEKMPIPVVCVGNITLGGAGKTPTVILLAQYLNNNNVNAHVVSRGYGGKFKDTVLVKREAQSAYEVGDEPLLISQHAKVWVSKEKKEGILAAHKAGAELVILDDGHQNFSIAKDVSILVFDTEVSLKNEKIFPLGNLRESLQSAIDRANFLICIGSVVSRKRFKKTFSQNQNIKVIEGKYKPIITPILRKRKLVAFCGIGRPEKFFSMLRNHDLEIIREYSFPDHHFYTRKQLTKILDVAQSKNALVVTTEKDYVKLPSNFTKIIYSVDIELCLEKNKKLLLDLKSLVS